MMNDALQRIKSATNAIKWDILQLFAKPNRIHSRERIITLLSEEVCEDHKE